MSPFGGKGMFSALHTDTIDKIRSYEENKKMWVTLDGSILTLKGALCSERCCGNLRVEWPRGTLPNKYRSPGKGKSWYNISKIFDRSL